MKEGPGAGGFHGSDPFDIFNMFFGGGGGGASPFGSRQEHRGKNLVHQLAVSLEELYNGAVRKLALQKNVVCDKCEGNRTTFSFSLLNYFFLLFRSWWKKRCCIKMYNL
jgi:DnaJ family protein A protein 1